MTVIAKNANVKNNYFSVIFGDATIVKQEALRKEVQAEKGQNQHPKKSYGFQPESEPVHSVVSRNVSENSILPPPNGNFQNIDETYRTSMKSDAALNDTIKGTSSIKKNGIPSEG
jgi:hypothetical protein